MCKAMHQRTLAKEKKLKDKQERNSRPCCQATCFLLLSCLSVAARDLQKEAEAAAKVRSNRRKALADKVTAQEQKAQATQAIRAVAKAEAAAARRARIAGVPAKEVRFLAASSPIPLIFRPSSPLAPELHMLQSHVVCASVSLLEAKDSCATPTKSLTPVSLQTCWTQVSWNVFAGRTEGGSIGATLSQGPPGVNPAALQRHFRERQ